MLPCTTYTNIIKTHPVIRLFVFLLSVLLVLLFAWWVALLYGAVMIILCRNYEMILLGVLLDVIYPTSGILIFETAVPFTVLLLLCVPLSWLLTQYVRGGQQKQYA